MPTPTPPSPTPNHAAGLDPETRARLEKTWEAAYRARTKDELRRVYADWAERYDDDHEAIGFIGHRVAAEILARRIERPETAKVLDAGAGTGAVGEELRRHGVEHLTAIDLSAEMLAVAAERGVYERLEVVDLETPVDAWRDDAFDAAILVGVFSYGQAEAHALDEIVRLVRPGGLVVFTARDDFWEEDAMGVRGSAEELESRGAWRLVETSDAHPYLPAKDPSVSFRVRCFEVLPAKRPSPSPEFVAAVREALDAPGPVRSIDHQFIWDAAGSRLYDAYTRRPEYYLTDCEEEILELHADQLSADHHLFVELGCGSARKIRHVLDAAVARPDGRAVKYLPIDVSAGALESTAAEVAERYGDRVDVRPLRGTFDDLLAKIPPTEPKTILFFGSSVGNIESREDIVSFLWRIGQRMTGEDRFVTGFDLQKDEATLLAAYNAGEENRMFFAHMVRRMNRLLGATFDVDAFRLGSECVTEEPHRGLLTKRVDLKVVSTTAQDVEVPALDRRMRLDRGDAFRVGISRKFRTDDLRILADLAGLRLRTIWLDPSHRFALAEMVLGET
ncbi:MAG: L-histidine N(alpha)-methyltransferase [Planctomycetota bacterium JB042]